MDSSVRKYQKYYWVMAFIRCFLVVLPQTGYIHPDEFFQSVEIFVGKFYEVENQPPWEVNATFPIRSMAIPYFTVGMSLKFLRDMNYLTQYYLGTTIITTYNILIITRLLMCALSFIVDFCLYKICLNNNEKYASRLLILSQSYVMIIYATRTFSNSLELVLFALLLYFVCDSLTFTNILSKKREYINYRYKHSKTISEKAKFHKLRLFLVSDSFRNCFIISTIVVCGFFNRPTFLVFAVIPVFFWLYRGIGRKSVTAIQFYTRMIMFILCSLPSFLLIITIDSFYYGYITWGELGMMEVSINNFVFTPLNFIKYNIDTTNLAQHGLHPRYLHALVNVPVLFNVLGLAMLCSIGYYIYLCSCGKYHLLPPVKSIKGLMVLSFLAPLVLLSYFPHQEPRFLIPLILPMVYLHGTTLLQEPNNVLFQIPSKSIEGQIPPLTRKSGRFHYLFRIWVICNIIFVLFFGFIHQGGVIKVVGYLQKQVNKPSMRYHIVTSHTYSTPMSLLLQKSFNKLYSGSSNTAKYSLKGNLIAYDAGSLDLDSVVDKLKNTFNRENSSRNLSISAQNKVYVVIPGSLVDDFEHLLVQKNIYFYKQKSFFPHISIEAFPNLNKYCLEFTSVFYKNCNILSFEDYFKKIVDLCKLQLYVRPWQLK